MSTSPESTQAEEVAPEVAPEVPPVSVAPVDTPAVPAAPIATMEAKAEPLPEKRTRAKVQLNTQQPEELKNAVDKAAAYLSFTTGKKVTTTDVVERALRVYLEQLPDAARGV